MLPKHQQHRKHREQIGRKPTDEPGLDLEHARIASSKASHAHALGGGMAGNVAKIRRSRTMSHMQQIENLKDMLIVVENGTIDLKIWPRRDFQVDFRNNP